MSKSEAQTILIADDEPLVLKITCAVLEAAGFQVLRAKDGPEALAVCQLHRGCIDLALLDYYMSGMNGGELAQRIKQDYPSVRIAVMTGYTEQVLRILGENAQTGKMAVLQKPFFPKQLVAFVNERLRCADEH